LIDLCERRGVLIHVTTHHRTYDPANGRDRRSLIEDATDSEYESWKISQRARRATAANAEAGKPHGRVPFGYRRRYDEITRRFVAQEPEPAEARATNFSPCKTFLTTRSAGRRGRGAACISCR
jgi:DNA invertase Pin-like site-specific DNA recombinase